MIVEIPNNRIDGECDGVDLITSIFEITDHNFKIYPNHFITYITMK